MIMTTAALAKAPPGKRSANGAEPMKTRAAKNSGNRERPRWPTPSIVVAGAALFIALGGSAVAANSLIHAGDIAPGAVMSKTIRNGGGGAKEPGRGAGG